jgi:hypothetical protein
MRLLRQTPEHNGTKLYERNCTSIQISGFYSWFICFSSINHFHILYLYLVCFHFVLFQPEMIYCGYTLRAVHFTLSLQYGFTELYGNVCITHNDIYWCAGVQQWLKQSMPSTPQNRLYSELCFFVSTKRMQQS